MAIAGITDTQNENGSPRRVTAAGGVERYDLPERNCHAHHTAKTRPTTRAAMASPVFTPALFVSSSRKTLKARPQKRSGNRRFGARWRGVARHLRPVMRSGAIPLALCVWQAGARDRSQPLGVTALNRSFLCRPLGSSPVCPAMRRWGQFGGGFPGLRGCRASRPRKVLYVLANSQIKRCRAPRLKRTYRVQNIDRQAKL